MWTCKIQTDERRALSKHWFFCLLASISQNDTNTKSNNFLCMQWWLQKSIMHCNTMYYIYFVKFMLELLSCMCHNRVTDMFLIERNNPETVTCTTSIVSETSKFPAVLHRYCATWISMWLQSGSNWFLWASGCGRLSKCRTLPLSSWTACWAPRKDSCWIYWIRLLILRLH